MNAMFTINADVWRILHLIKNTTGYDLYFGISLTLWVCLFDDKASNVLDNQTNSTFSLSGC